MDKPGADRKPGDAEVGTELEVRPLGEHAEMLDLVDRSASLNWMIEQQNPAPAQAAPAAATWAAGVTRFDVAAAQSWPWHLQSQQYYARVLQARATGEVFPPNVDEATVTQTWQSMTNSEIQALWAISENDKENPPVEADRVLARIAPLRLQARTVLFQAEELLVTGRKLEVDQETIDALSRDLATAAKDWLDPLILEGVNGETERVRDSRTVRRDLAVTRQEIERAVARMRGWAEPKGAKIPAANLPAGGKKQSPVLAERSPGFILTFLKGFGAIVLVAGAGYLVVHDLLGYGKPVFPSLEPVPVFAPAPPPPKAAAATPPPVVDPAVAAQAAREQECARAAGARRFLEAGALRVRGTLSAERNSTAVLADSREREEVVKVGDYVGTHCWKVASIEMDSVTIVNNEPAGSVPGPHSMRVPVTVAGPKHKK